MIMILTVETVTMKMMIYHHHHHVDDEHGDGDEHGDQPGPFRLPLRDRDNDFLNLPTGLNERLTD